MKRIICLLLSAVFIFSLTGCSKHFIGNEIQKMAGMATKETKPTKATKATTEPTTEAQTYKLSNDTYTVTRVIDGDTIEVYIDGDTVRIRLIGIDTPESVHSDESKNCYFGSMASDYTTLALTGKEVQLEYDEEPLDQYGRTLAYVYVDGELFNETLALEGYAVAKEYPPNTKYASRLKLAQINAEKAQKGMWSDDITVEDCPLKESCYIEY